jgi:ATP-dependent helicase HrpB
MTKGATLPVDAFLDRIAGHLHRSRAVVITAQPGAGKTTRVPPSLIGDGPVILLQPRRVAARAIAARIADERGWPLGREVGWQVRFERRFGADTRLLVVTEGILSARLQADPLLSGFRTIVLDEFHERSVHADLAIALARQAWLARDDLRIVVMSATLDTTAVSAFLGHCPIVEVPGRVHPLEISYAPGQGVADAAVELIGQTEGNVLCFLPGAPEIRRTMADLQTRIGGAAIDVLPLHGSLDADAQDAALASSSRRRIIVATNVAETSVTVPGVTAVVDSGWHKIARYDAGRGIDSLALERITADAAEQRAGRAGRVAAGVVRRLWDSRDRLRPHREPEIQRVDLSSTVLDVIAWGADPRALDWFERPGDDALDAALTLLERLGLVAATKLTDLGDRVRRLPIHPRLGRMLVAGGAAREIARACAVVSERHLLPPRTASTSSDLLSAVDDWRGIPWHVQRVATEIESIAAAALPASPGAGGSRAIPLSELDFRRAVFAGYPDRVAERREPQSPRLRLASGAGAVLGRESGVTDGEFLVAIDVQARADGDAIVRLASRVEREWLQANGSERVHRFDYDSGAVKATLVERYDALVLAERPVPPDEDVAAELLAGEWIARGPAAGDQQLLRRLRFAAHEIDLGDLVRTAARGVRALKDVRLERAVSSDMLRSLDRDAPETIVVPSGRAVRLEYAEDGSVSASVKLQELFGLSQTPCVGRRREPVVLALLAPNGRPVQLTRDLQSFWNRTYPEVRKELRGRYPKHPWPEDPWNAPPTARVKKPATRGRR